jgi:thiamine-phosphate pyrophosphorylase
VKPTSPGLYAIADVDTLEKRGLDVERAALAMISGGPRWLQLRAKRASAAQSLRWLRALAEPARRAGVLLFENDRADLARAAACDGVHVGQDDLELADVRRCFPGLAVGVSTHDAAQFARALAERPDYVAFGPIFPTRSKENPDPVVGLDALRALAATAHAVGVPVVAIGGITEDTAAAVSSTGASVALISALMPSPDLNGDEAYAAITQRTRHFAALLSR